MSGSMWIFAVVSLVLFCCAVGLMVSHHRSWRLTRENESDEAELDFRRRQYRRRMQTSAMMGLLVASTFFGQFITGPPVLMVGFWAGVLLLVVWIALLAGADYLATRYHLSRLRHDYIIEEARLHAEVRRIRSVQGNGRHGRRLTKKRKPDAEADDDQKPE